MIRLSASNMPNTTTTIMIEEEIAKEDANDLHGRLSRLRSIMRAVAELHFTLNRSDQVGRNCAGDSRPVGCHPFESPERTLIPVIRPGTYETISSRSPAPKQTGHLSNVTSSV